MLTRSRAAGVPASTGRVRVTRTAGAAPDAKGTGCPVSGLMAKLPPLTQRPWWQELNFTMAPFQAQSGILQGRPVARGNYLMSDAVLVGDAELAKGVLACEGDRWDVSIPPHLRALLGSESIGAVDEPQHSRIRGLLAPAFAAEEVDAYLGRIQGIAERTAARWAAAGQVPSMHLQLKLFTFEVICSVVAGFNFDQSQLQEMAELCETLAQGINFPLPLDVPFTPFGKAMAARREICSRLLAHIEAMRSGPQGLVGLVAVMLAARDPDTGEGLSEQQLLDNFISLLIAGHDTTASTLNIVCYYLATCPDVWARLQEEQRAVAAAHGAAVTPAAMADMRYTTAVIREAWRLHPVVPVSGRRPRQAAQLGEWVLPADQPTWVALNYIMRSDPRWAGAEGDLAEGVFNPERFLAPSGTTQGAQLVFGAGRRSCIGANLAMADLKVMLAVLARGYSFRVAPDSVQWQEMPFPNVRMDCADFDAAAA